MKVLIACEFSGIVRDAFIAKGHDAISCDLLPTEAPGPHYQGDVRDLLTQNFDLMIAHPPCTHLAVSGARWFHKKRPEQQEALDFVRLLMAAPIPRICIENPVSIISSHIRRPDQIIQPFYFGDDAMKTTCLWLQFLPLLAATKVVEPRMTTYKSSGKPVSAWFVETSNIPKPRQAQVRSITFPGIAQAMADQWG